MLLPIFVLFSNFLSFKKNLVQIGSLQAKLYLENLQNCDRVSEKRLYLKNYIGNRQNVTPNFQFVWI